MILQQYKIVFAGSMGAGKTEAIRSLSEIPVLATEAFNTDDQSHKKMNTTVGIDYGEVTLEDGNKVGLYGTPGQGRFDFMWGVICKGAIGMILLIDHSIENPLKDLEFYINIFIDSLRNISSTMYEIFVNELNCAGMYSYRFLRSNDDTVPGNHITNAVHIFIGCSGIHRVMVVTSLMIYLEIVDWMDWCRHGRL